MQQAALRFFMPICSAVKRLKSSQLVAVHKKTMALLSQLISNCHVNQLLNSSRATLMDVARGKVRTPEENGKEEVYWTQFRELAMPPALSMVSLGHVIVFCQMLDMIITGALHARLLHKVFSERQNKVCFRQPLSLVQQDPALCGQPISCPCTPCRIQRSPRRPRSHCQVVCCDIVLICHRLRAMGAQPLVVLGVTSCMLVYFLP
jgi:hypothetical protein